MKKLILPLFLGLSFASIQADPATAKPTNSKRIPPPSTQTAPDLIPSTGNYTNPTRQQTNNNQNRGYVAEAPTAAQNTNYANEKKFPKDQFKTESDRAINRRIREQMGNWIDDDFTQIVLRTSEGLVVVDGFVSSPENQQKLFEGIETVNGVKHAVNNTHVKAKTAANLSR